MIATSKNKKRISSQPLKWHGDVEIRRIPGFLDHGAGSDGNIYRTTARGGGGMTPAWTSEIEPKRMIPDKRPSDGRKRYTLRYCAGTYKRRYGSYFVLLAWSGPKPEGMEACHDDGDCTNDKPNNLRWDTPKNNKADMVRHGTQPRGEKHPKAKVTDAQATAIVMRRAEGESLKALAAEFNITESAVCFIAKGRRKSCL